MRPEALNLAVRPRRPQEAADLGARLVQAHARSLYPVWFLLLLPVLVLAVAAERLSGHAIGLLLLWWMKPLYDYGQLWVLSQAVFGEAPGWRQLPSALPGFFREGLGSALTLRRLSNSRAYVLPVWMLEGQSGTERRRRISLLRRNSTSSSRLLHQLFALMESLLLLATLSIPLWFSPDLGAKLTQLTDFFKAPLGSLRHELLLLAYGVAMSIVEPVYVAAGFMLYLNRRTDLEAWDMEIALRRLAGRLGNRGPQ